MNLKDARALRDRIIATAGWHCTVPTGYGPNGYFARIITCRNQPTGPKDFHSEREWVAYRVGMLRETILARREYERKDAELDRLIRRSPLDVLIDRACGVEP